MYHSKCGTDNVRYKSGNGNGGKANLTQTVTDKVIAWAEEYDEAKLRERYEFITGADFDATMLLERIDAIPGTAENNVEGFNASKCLLWQDPAFGVLDKELFGTEDAIEAHEKGQYSIVLWFYSSLMGESRWLHCDRYGKIAYTYYDKNSLAPLDLLKNLEVM